MRIVIREKRIGIVVFIDLLCAFVIGWGLSGDTFPTLTMFQRVLIGFGCMVVFLGLYFVKIIGKILQIFCSLLWTVAITECIPLEKWTNNSKPWIIGVKIVLFLIFLGIHTSFYEDWKEDFTEDTASGHSGRRKEKKLQRALRSHLKKTVEAFEEAALGFEAAKKATSAIGKSIDDIEYLIANMKETLSGLEEALKSDRLNLEDLQEMGDYLENADGFIEELFQNTAYLLDEYSKQAESASSQEPELDGYEEMFFAGCNDKESVKLRYKQLMQSFHPDQRNGDEEMAKRIQNAYEAKMAKM